MNKCDERGYNFLFPNTPWIYDGVSNTFTNLSDEYKIKPDMNMPAINSNAAAYELYNSKQA